VIELVHQIEEESFVKHSRGKIGVVNCGLHKIVFPEITLRDNAIAPL